MKVLVFGTFDRLHPGHLHFLREAGKRGHLFVVVARDANVLRIKGRPALQPEEERKRAIEREIPAAGVLLGDPENFLAPILHVEPDLILLGYDQELPPGIRKEEFPCPVERLEAFHPEKFKSSIRRPIGRE